MSTSVYIVKSAEWKYKSLDINSYSIFCLFIGVTAATFGDKGMLDLRHFSKHSYRNYFEKDNFLMSQLYMLCFLLVFRNSKKNGHQQRG